MLSTAFGLTPPSIYYRLVLLIVLKYDTNMAMVDYMIEFQ